MDILRTRIFWIGVGVGILLLFLWLMIFRWPAAAQIRLKQESLLTAIEDGSSGRLNALLADSYKDEWEWDRDEAMEAFRELRRQFLVLGLEPSNESLAVDGHDAVISMELTFQGSGSPIAQMIMAEATKLKSPFNFYWEKQSMLPWSWKLVGVENSAVRIPAGYKPGMERF